MFRYVWPFRARNTYNHRFNIIQTFKLRLPSGCLLNADIEVNEMLINDCHGFWRDSWV